MKPSRPSQSRPPSASLPDVPDFPDSPLSAWKHYGILKLAEEKLHKELEQIGYDGNLVGLRVSYFVGQQEGKIPQGQQEEEDSGDEYTMAYGYDVTDKVETRLEDKNPPSEEFILSLYDFISDMIANNISPYVPEFTLRLDTTFNPVRTTYTVTCRVCRQGQCLLNAGHEGERRRMIRINRGAWRCLHTRC